MSNAIGRRAALTLSVAATLGLPAIGRAAQNTLRYVPYSNLIVFDPVWAISIIGLEHAYIFAGNFERRKVPHGLSGIHHLVRQAMQPRGC